MPTKRKAIGEIVGALILMLIVSIAGTILFTISLRSSDDQTKILSSQLSDEGDSAQERFTNLYTFIKDENGEHIINIWIYNYGDIDINIKSIYINNPYNGDVLSINLNDDEGLIRSNNIKYITKSINDEFFPYTVNLVSERGVKNVSKWDS